MLKGALVGAIVLTLGMTSLASAETMQVASYERGSDLGITVKETHIARLKAVLNLTPEQRPYWAPVEAALRALVRGQEASAGGIMQRASAAAVDAVKLRRLAAVARPLIKVLDDGQKREAMVLVRNLGFDRVMAAF
jgi:hypothetical protein